MFKWFRKPRVYFMNDTTEGHSGSQAAMRSLVSELKHCKIIGHHKVGTNTIDLDQFEAADWIVVNGEGTIHHHAPMGEFLLSCLARAQDAGKKTALVNCVYQQPTNNYPGVLENLDLLTVREALSYSCAAAHGGKPEIRLDSAADRRMMGRGIPIPGLDEIAYGATHPAAPTHGAIKHTNFGLAASFDDIVATLRNVEVYVTGQHHGIYAAALARCSFVALEGNSHKISGLIEWSKCPIPVIQTADADIDAAIEWARNNRPIYDRFFDWFSQQDVTRLQHLIK